MNKTYSHRLAREEKESYLSDLSLSFSLLGQRLLKEDVGRNYLTRVTQDFGTRNNWDLTRLTNISSTHSELASLISRVKNEYLWFADSVSNSDSSLNRAYHDEITLNAISGLVWQHDFISLSRLKSEAKQRLQKMPTVDELAREYTQIHLSDDIEIEDVQNKALKIHKTMLKRNYLEQLDNYSLLSSEPNGFAMKPSVEKRFVLGSESLWNIQFLKYSLAYGFFTCYSIDLWKDINDTEISGENGSVKLSSELEKKLISFSERTQAWHILQQIDEKFPHLHPVHVSKALVGPFENKYRTRYDEDFKMPEVFLQIINEDKDATFLRLNRQYSYAPNQEEINGVRRQIIYQEPWSEEYVVVPAKYSQRVATAIHGDGVKIVEK